MAFFKGILCAFHSCGILLKCNEMIKSESRRSVMHILKECFEYGQKSFKNCIYGDACHLHESIKCNNLLDKFLELKSVSCFIDRFHIKNHIRSECKTLYNLNFQHELNEINSEICEQKFVTINKYKNTIKYMDKNHFNFFLLCNFEKNNEETLKKIANKNKVKNLN